MVAGKLIIAGRWIKYKAKTVNTFNITVLKRFKVAGRYTKYKTQL